MKRRAIEVGLAALCMTVLPLGTANAWQAATDTLRVGDPAPDFKIPSTVPIPESGSTVSISAITGTGRSVVLAFFPKAFTGG
jgi:hypothetical protein